MRELINRHASEIGMNDELKRSGRGVRSALFALGSGTDGLILAGEEGGQLRLLNPD
ncbi:prephenate dehydrogenase [Aspergillus luchuensis]|uniref:Prephenate dehydrogenase n=1 Tax=Aspergillus kawachii TaxID=1069201 RepID=A0A146F617_ASPKA|nr:prephenate dehydrogenase [Aspergillus luchuensis]